VLVTAHIHACTHRESGKLSK